MKLTKTELVWIASWVKARLENVEELMNDPELENNPFCQLEYENMSALLAKLDYALASGAKCISIE